MGGSWRIALGVLVVGLWSARCGSSATGGTGSTGGPDGGPVASADAGSGSDAGAGGGGGGAADAGGGGGPADAGSGGGGPGDAGSGGGGVAAGCEGVVPDRLGASFSFDVPGLTFPGADWRCDSDTSDESGNVASHLVYGKSYVAQRWHLFDSNGAHRAELYALGLFPQGSGFEGIFEISGDQVPSFNVGLWAPDGRRTGGPRVGGDIVPSAIRAWPNGLLTLNAFCNFHDHRESFTLRRFDPSLKELAPASVTFPCAIVAGVAEDGNGNRLLLVGGASAEGFREDDLLGYWFDSSGKALTGWFRVGPGGAAGQTHLVHALIGGGVAVQVDGAWTYFIPSGKAEAQAAPAFLADNPNTDFTLVRGAKAYAVLPRAGDTTQMKLYSSGGDLCGTVKFPKGSLTTGADGSAIASSGDRGCTKTVWPGLLR